MTEFALLIFILSIALYVAAIVLKKRMVFFLPFLLSVCSVVLTITDTTVGDVELLVIILIDIYIFLMSLASMVIKGVN